jgi:hypothetical protein
MSKVMGEATTPGASTKVLLLEAIEDAIKKAPPPSNTDIQHFEVLKIEVEHGGFVGSTRTRVTVDAKPGPLPDGQGAAASYNV